MSSKKELTERLIQQLSMFRMFWNITMLFTSVSTVDVRVENTEKEKSQKYKIVQL